jgi:multicomponent Na+:H+ antiporter subunit D
MELVYANLPVLVVVTPLFGGLLSLFTYRNPFSWLWACLVTSATYLIALALLRQVLASPTGKITYPMGWWPPEWGIEYVIDPANAWVLTIISAIAVVATIYARVPTEAEIPLDRQNLFYAVWLLAITGMMGITATGDAFNVYVLLEISSLTVYTLVALGMFRDRRALTASIKYVILGSIGATFILLGIGYLLMATGTLNMADMHAALQEMDARGELRTNRTVMTAFAFLMVGFSMKMALWPLHGWQPNAYTYAPSAVTALIASTATKVGAYMTLRFVFTIFGPSYVDDLSLDLMILCAAAGIVVSGLQAMRQHDVRTLLAWSSVGQLAYIVLGIALMNHAGVTAALLHVFAHALTKGGMFMAVGCIAYSVGSHRVSDLKGLRKKMPLSVAALTIGGLGLVGFPGTAGFASKWYLVQSAIERGQWWLAVIVLLGSLLALVYTWRLVEAIFLKKPDIENADRDIREAPAAMLVPTWTLIIASVYFGIFAQTPVEIAEAAANVLLGGAR